MDFQPNTPIWLQGSWRIKSEMITGKFPPGSKLPSSRELAMQYGINPNTAARIYLELEKEHLCETRRGLGTFVTQDADRIAAVRQELARTVIQHYLRSMQALGFTRQEAACLLKEE